MLSGHRESGCPVRLLACGGCAVGLFWALGLILAGLSRPIGLVGQARQCRSNLTRLSRAMLLYAHDHDDRLPPAASWLDTSRPYWKDPSLTRCPAAKGPVGRVSGYAMNARLGGKSLATVRNADTIPLLFDAVDLTPNASSSLQSLPSPGRHTWREKRGTPLVTGSLVGYVSGNVRFVADKPPAAGRQ
jgi:hypothetical protein